MTKLVILCTLETGLDSIYQLSKSGYEIECIIGLKPNNYNNEDISGYIDIGNFARENKINYFYVEKYNMNCVKDKKLFSNLEIDLLWVNGWQRLLPNWLLKIPNLGTVGCHGSPDGITMGRGRSPQNWALLLGCKSFEIAMFKLKPGVDDGPVIMTKSFFYNYDDDIRTSYYKVSLLIYEMILDLLDNLSLLNKAVKQTQLSAYLPQRYPDDGIVDWNSSKYAISRSCKALTKPYPGLRCFDKKTKIVIWKCQPFDDKISHKIGYIDVCFNSKEFLVNCLDGRLLVREYTSSLKEWLPKEGIYLEGKDFLLQLRKIEKRHNKNNPNQKISPRLKRWTDLRS